MILSNFGYKTKTPTFADVFETHKHDSKLAALALMTEELGAADDDNENRPDPAHNIHAEPAKLCEEKREADQQNAQWFYFVVRARAVFSAAVHLHATHL